MQFCGYPTLKWDLVGCLGLNTRKNEKKPSSDTLKGDSPEKTNYIVVGLTDNLILWAVGLNSNYTSWVVGVK